MKERPSLKQHRQLRQFMFVPAVEHRATSAARLETAPSTTATWNRSTALNIGLHAMCHLFLSRSWDPTFAIPRASHTVAMYCHE